MQMRFSKLNLTLSDIQSLNDTNPDFDNKPYK